MTHDKLYLTYVARMRDVYAGTAEANALRDQIINDPDIWEHAEAILDMIATYPLSWHVSLIRVGCRRAIVKRDQAEEHRRAVEHQKLMGHANWGRF
jgi:hypothetical protein